MDVPAGIEFAEIMTTWQAPLAGVRVVDFGQYIAAPGAAQVLADLGADVIKVEQPGGESARWIGTYGEAMLRCYNRRKRSIAIDLKEPAGVEVVRRLVADADVVTQNMRPGVLDRLGFGPRRVRALNPRVIYVSIIGFGTAGPSRDRAAYDIAAQAESGMMAITGDAAGEPQRVGFTVVDAAAASSAAQAILAALFRRERSGEGDEIEVSLLGVAIHLQGTIWAEYEQTGVVPRRRGNGQPTLAPAADLVATRDGHIVLSAYTDAHWRRLCAVVGRPELAEDSRFVDNPARVAHRDELARTLAEALGGYTSEQAVAVLAGGGLVAAVVRTHDQVVRAPDVTSGRYLMAGTTADGARFHAPVLPFGMAGWPVTDAGTPPSAGQHTVEILGELGYPEDTVRDLLASGAASPRGG